MSWKMLLQFLLDNFVILLVLLNLGFWSWRWMSCWFLRAFGDDLLLGYGWMTWCLRRFWGDCSVALQRWAF